MMETIFGTSERPSGTQNGTKKWSRNTQNDIQNEVCKIRFYFNQNVLPQRGPRDPQGGPKGTGMAPKRDSWATRNRPNEVSRGSECIQNNISKIDVNFEDPKVVKRRSRRPFWCFQNTDVHSKTLEKCVFFEI